VELVIILKSDIEFAMHLRNFLPRVFSKVDGVFEDIAVLEFSISVIVYCPLLAYLSLIEDFNSNMVWGT
jgi:hypothetical protein